MKTILSEEEYMTRLGAILKRDYFPTLQDDFSPPEQLNINEFQRLFTTEDNASFAELLARENERKRVKFEKIYGGPAALVDNPSQRILVKASEVDESKFKEKNNSKSLGWNGSNDDSKRSYINLNNTRFNSGNASTPTGSKFRIQETPAREQLAHSLATPKRPQSSKSTTPRVEKNKTTPRAYSMKDLKGLTPSRKSK